MLSIDYCYVTYIKQSPLFDGFLLIFSGLWNNISYNRFFASRGGFGWKWFLASSI